ncbi:Ldh family oxidoreductase [Burkholderia vietnamiensis]|uniref:Ldh family oxidoreductase n=1 Tax=Burkholderia vietnamiensis TaxID=60552 RepID=UPI00265135BC|nr:Ldh family oxidoreductase [Burkholderia vietnamiensis]MDN8035937.1 Ldh family oxidoreductase [Burkholderia vietnamiensis]HDR8925043.1 Ldh family oxidoreductase [Burkholderia vietnamiensis]HDR9215296.1 Ldh family oxidoreductase [Burkholderia vietnamiensis]
MKYECEAAWQIAFDAIRGAGANDAIARSLAEATISAELAGSKAVGFAHLPDYLDGFARGRIAANAEPDASFPALAAIRVDARGGIAHLAYDRVFDELVSRASTYGVVTLAVSNSFTVGELGYYTRRLAERGFVALGTCNATAQMTTLESGKAVYGTNPVSFAAPVANARPFVIDQASSATAFVSVRKAAEAGEAIPEGWAVDEHGRPTTDARAAINGLLLPFGGARGANIAMMMEILAAGVTGANWSMDAPHYAKGGDTPGVGLFLVAVKADVFAEDFDARLAAQIERLSQAGVRIPGSHIKVREIDVADDVMDKVRSFGSGG